MTASSYVAGWYPDPSGEPIQRYYDGARWTEYTSQGSGQGVAQTQVASPAAAAAPVAPTHPAGWYPDPSGYPVQRYYDGTRWTEHTSQQQQQQAFAVNQQVVIASGGGKSGGLAFLLGFLFGPLGMLYATVTGAVIMFFVILFTSMIIGFITVGFGLFIWLPICWLICGIWAASAASGSGHLSVQQGAAR